MLSNSSSLEGRPLSHSVHIVRFNGDWQMLSNTPSIGIAVAWTAVLAASGFIVAIALLA